LTVISVAGFSGGGGSGATATSVRPIAAVISITVNNQGSGYTSEPTVSFSGGDGSGATATSVVGNRTVTGVTLTNAGSGYTDAPTVSFSGGGGGSGAAAHVVISLTGITVTNSGSGYSNPTVSITGGGGSGATATATVGVVDTSKQFTGQRLDSTDLYYYNARYYDPTIGRFISPDIVVQNSANPQTLNRYCYCLNNPLKYTDPTGHFNDDGSSLGGAWSAGTVIKVVVPAVIQSGGVGIGFAPIDDSQFAPQMPVENEPKWPSFDGNSYLAVSPVVGLLAADDASGVGVVDDVIIPVIVAGATFAFVYQNHDEIGQAVEYISYHVSNWWDSVFYSEHTKGKRQSTEDKHEKGQERKIRDQRGEKGDARRPYQKPPRK